MNKPSPFILPPITFRLHLLGITSNCLFYTVAEEWFLISNERLLYLGEALHAISPYSLILKLRIFSIFNLMPHESQSVILRKNVLLIVQ
jgi:hypothetical protein